jgi:type IV pilus assembly protein PilX
MYMTARKMTSRGPRKSRGVSLIIVLILMIIIGITASTAMRNATSEQRATNNQRMEATALQYAEAALRFCEAQMKLPPSTRSALTLQGTIPGPLAPGPTTSGWEDPLTWTGALGRASSTRTVVPNNVIQDSALNTVLPTRNPECVVETQTGGATVITARGFSTDYQADGPTGQTIRGAVVWVQSFN